jgi:hypothetical protein
MAHMKEQEINATQAGLPVYPPFGMTTIEFAECQKQFTNFARTRIYAGAHYDKLTHQRMEELSAEEIVSELREEIADAVNYLTGLDIYLQRIPWKLVEHESFTL